tara:strand:+ start:101 stop:343 length:243 start_codon:yes stop_codon:yes gene_type:complete
MTTFINDSRIHLSNNNVEINEGIYFPKITISPVPLEPIDLKSSHRKIRAFKLSIKRRRIFSRENRISLKKQRHKPKVSKG